MSQKNFAVMGIGSNIEREKNFKKAFRHLKKSFPKIVFSKIFKTKPKGFAGKKMFFNAAAKFKTKKTKKEIWMELKAIEKKVGRKKRRKKAGSREIDLDLLLFNNKVNDKTVFEDYNIVCLKGFLTKKQAPAKLEKFLGKKKVFSKADNAKRQ